MRLIILTGWAYDSKGKRTHRMVPENVATGLAEHLADRGIVLYADADGNYTTGKLDPEDADMVRRIARGHSAPCMEV